MNIWNFFLALNLFYGIPLTGSTNNANLVPPAIMEKDVILLVDTIITPQNLEKDSNTTLIQQDDFQKNYLQSPIAQAVDMAKTVLKDSMTVQEEKTDTISPQMAKLKMEQERKLQIQISKQERLLNSAWKKYYNIHSLLERYVKLEATERLLNIKHYNTTTKRVNNNKSGLQFVVRSQIPAGTSLTAARKDLLKLTESFTNALVRYSQVSNKAIDKTDAQITLTFYGNVGTALISSVEQELNKLSMTYSTQQLSSDQLVLHIALSSDNFFQTDLVKWEQTEQKINRDIRILEKKMESLK